jgi:hypothetical protein
MRLVVSVMRLWFFYMRLVMPIMWLRMVRLARVWVMRMSLMPILAMLPYLVMLQPFMFTAMLLAPIMVIVMKPLIFTMMSATPLAVVTIEPFVFAMMLDAPCPIIIVIFFNDHCIAAGNDVDIHFLYNINIMMSMMGTATAETGQC